MIATRRWLLTTVPLAALTGCLSPNPQYYSLQPVPGAVAPPGAPRAIGLRAVALASYLDRSEIVRGMVGYQLQLSPGRWSEPLADLIGRVLAQDLMQRLPGSVVASASGLGDAVAEVTVTLAVQRFDQDSDGTLVLLAEALVHTPHGDNPPQSFRLTTKVSAPTGQMTAPEGLAGILGPNGIAGQMAAMSTVLGELADQLAAQLAKS